MKTLLMVLLLACACASADATTLLIDQQQPAIDLSVGAMAIGGASNQKVAQTVTAGLHGQLVQVDLPIVCESGRLIIQIQGLTPTGTPNGTIYAMKTLAGKNLPTSASAQLQPVAFKTKVVLQQGEKFAIVLQNRGGSCAIYQGPPGNPYAAGGIFFDDSVNNAGWIDNSQFNDRDLPFQTWMLIAN